MSPRWTHGLWAGTVVLGVVGLVLLLLPPRVTLPEVAPPPVPQAAEQLDATAVAAALLSFEEISRSNVFSDRRRPPARRYVPPELREAERQAGAGSRPAAPRLFGVASGPGGALALIDADPSIPGAEIYRVGDRIGGATIVSITDSTVVLQGTSGRTVLRLPS